MGRYKISDLATATELNSDDTLEVVQGGQSKKITKQAASALPIESFSTTLTFDDNKELATVSGGSRAFTLNGSGNINGIGILCKINNPVAVTFSSDFEIGDGSSTIGTANMNIITFHYFSDYNGSGTKKVIYFIKNQISV